eukprot:365679-Chlamydomonas_euryale.AAC.5
MRYTACSTGPNRCTTTSATRSHMPSDALAVSARLASIHPRLAAVTTSATAGRHCIAGAAAAASLPLLLVAAPPLLPLGAPSCSCHPPPPGNAMGTSAIASSASSSPPDSAPAAPPPLQLPCTMPGCNTNTARRFQPSCMLLDASGSCSKVTGKPVLPPLPPRSISSGHTPSPRAWDAVRTA